MKQHIKPKQAKELSEQQFYALFPGEVVPRPDWANVHHKKITIGKLIEYLDDIEITKGNDDRWLVTHITNQSQYAGFELIDVLWKLTIRDVAKHG